MYYMIYRRYSKKERPDTPKNGRSIFYGWTQSKSVAKAFISQRDKNKYNIYKINSEEIGDLYSENYSDTAKEIDYIKLTSAATGDEIMFLTTAEEENSAEKKIQSYFKDLCRLVDKDNGNTTLLNMYLNLKDKYQDMLEYVGFNPPEVNYLFDASDPDDDIDDIIDSAYEGYSEYPCEEYKHQSYLPGATMLPEVSQKILYSVESFIKVLKEDL